MAPKKKLTDKERADAIRILAVFLPVEPMAWGVPTELEDEGWTPKRYARAFKTLDRMVMDDE